MEAVEQQTMETADRGWGGGGRADEAMRRERRCDRHSDVACYLQLPAWLPAWVIGCTQ